MKNVVMPLFLFIFGLCLYALTVRGIYGPLDLTKARGTLDTVTKPLELSPERGRFVLTYSLAEKGSFALDEKLAKIADPDVGYYKGKYYIYFAPGISILALPFYLLGKIYNIPQVASFFTISLFAAINLVLIYIISKKVFKISTAFAVFSAIIFGFASTSWSYAITLYQHHVTTFFILSSFLAVWNYRSVNRMRWFYASYVWLAYGLAIFLDYPNIILLAPCIGYLLFSALEIKKGKTITSIHIHPAAILSSFFLVVLVLLHGYYNYIHFDSWTRLSGSLIGYDKVREVKKNDKNKKNEIKIEELANKKAGSSFFKEENLPRGFSILTFSSDRGLFIFSPIFYLMLLGMYKKIRHGMQSSTFFLLSIVFTDLFLYSSWGDPWGGWAFGPRYLIPSMAIGSCFIGYWIYTNRHPIFARTMAFGLFVVSLVISLLGALTTNQVPPKVEADFVGLNYNFFLNKQYFDTNLSSSFVYNTYLHNHLTLPQYYFVILVPIIALASILLFLSPLHKQKINEH